ncbi:hypothetical protein BDK92_4237 [Micromonospora pisi]|uniref:Actin-binding WH2 domain-containing protein n=1 Tax=Micromonospora pisi TaxID=589240 RepID=A0A495JMT0_9ACTN|nr:hypothetical protein [Micromonospora pisi]RKR89878.1 hypothetical protein BDK92_4237 [Micromonospora pisi]
MATDGSGPLVIERILRDRHGIWQQVVADRDLNALTGKMLAASTIALACYGAVLGAFHSFLMALTSAVKLPLLFLVTLAICLPTLYLFNLVFGARLSVRQAVSMVMVAITVTSMLAVAFAPISLFFLITAPDYGFFKLLNVAILTLSAFVGLRFLTGGMQVLNEHGLLAPTTPAQVPATATPATVGAPLVEGGVPAQPVPATVGAVNGDGTAPAAVPVAAATPVPPPALVAVATQPHPQFHPAPAGFYRPQPAARVATSGQRPASMTLLYIWILLFGFVGTQLAWTLRPFFGSPDQDFAFFRSIEGNFYAEILRTIANL